MTDRDACFERVQAEAIDYVIDVLSDCLSSSVADGVVKGLLDRISRSESAYERVVLSLAALVIADHTLPLRNQLEISCMVRQYRDELCVERGFDSFDVTDV